MLPMLSALIRAIKRREGGGVGVGGAHLENVIVMRFPFLDVVPRYGEARCYSRYNKRTFTLLMPEAVNLIVIHQPFNETCARP